jgi:hypothetical protein
VRPQAHRHNGLMLMHNGLMTMQYRTNAQHYKIIPPDLREFINNNWQHFRRNVSGWTFPLASPMLLYT